MKRRLFYVLHIFTGHPRDRVHWGTAEEGATCKACGFHWTLADYY